MYLSDDYPKEKSEGDQTSTQVVAIAPFYGNQPFLIFKQPLPRSRRVVGARDFKAAVVSQPTPSVDQTLGNHDCELDFSFRYFGPVLRFSVLDITLTGFADFLGPCSSDPRWQLTVRTRRYYNCGARVCYLHSDPRGPEQHL